MIGMIVCILLEAAAILILGMLCHRLYGDVVGMARSMAGMPDKPDTGKSRVISPYKKKKEGDGS